MESLVATFNSLPRVLHAPSDSLLLRPIASLSLLAPSDMIDHNWHFTIQNAQLGASGDHLFITNLQSGLAQAVRLSVTLTSSAAEKAKEVVPLLVKVFVSGFGFSQPLRVAPWTWATTDSELAREVEKELEAVGVRQPLRTVKTGNLVKDLVAQTHWVRFMERQGSLDHLEV
ncbi:hypothetical protein MMC13_004243 [Lambiella insularis]|nr:hypothetical protein [Lambiella insularis]